VFYRALLIGASLAHFASVSPCQVNPADGAQTDATNAAPHNASKHIFGIIPNFRTSPSLTVYAPITPREKFGIAAQDSFDRGTVVLAAAFAGESQLSNDNRSFGQGTEGYAKYFGAAYADFVIGNYMTEGIFPTLLHQDPRYFRRGTGSAWSRIGYSIGQIFWTHRDSGATQFNYSEVVGNSTAVALSNIYYKGGRSAPDAVSQLGFQIGIDTATNILKEFWPDFDRKFKRKRQ
jgi:hypothetical protein